MKRFWKRGEGSVSVYLIIVIMPIFLFQALFVDVIRVRLAERETELALKSGLRSVMSRYDQALAQYGLYGQDWQQADSEEVFWEGMEGNLENRSSASFRYVDTVLEKKNSNLSAIYTLGNPDVLKRQIAQEMKVKAPVEFITELVDKFKKTGTATAFEQAADYSDQAKKLQALHEKREEALDRSWNAARDMIAVAKLAAQSAEQELASLNQLAGRIGIRSMDEMRTSLAQIEQDIANLSNGMDSLARAISMKQSVLASLSGPAKEQAELIRSLLSEISNLQSGLSSLSSQMNVLSTSRAAHIQLLADMTEYTARYSASRLTIAGREQAVAVSYEQLRQALELAVKAHEDWQAELERLKQSSSGNGVLPQELFQFESLYGQDYFTMYQVQAAKIPAAMNGLLNRWSAVEWWQSAQWREVYDQAGKVREQISNFESKRKSDEAARDARNNAVRQEEQANRSKIGSTLAEMNQALGPCGLGADPYRELYQKLEGSGGLAAKYKNYSKLNIMPTSVSSLSGDPDRAVSQGFSLIRQIGSLLGGFRDEWLINEYALNKFNYRTTGLPAGAGNGAGATSSSPEKHPLVGQEAEYVLYGFNSCSANMGAAYGELFAMLFGIRTVEALLEPRTQSLQLGSPLLVLLAAAAEGGVKALRDVKALTDGGTVPLVQKLSTFKLGYKDFLRLFLLLHPNQSGVLTRIQALLELNTGVDLTVTTTYIQGSAGTSVKLWFMPGLMKILNKSTGIGDTIEKGRLQIKRMAVYSYD